MDPAKTLADWPLRTPLSLQDTFEQWLSLPLSERPRVCLVLQEECCVSGVITSRCVSGFPTLTGGLWKEPALAARRTWRLS